MKNNLLAKVQFLEKAEKGIISSMFGKPKAQEAVEPNKIQINIYKIFDKQEVSVAVGDGLWTRYVQFDNVIYWQLDDPIETWVGETAETALPSSSAHRKEIKMIAEKKFLDADKWGY